MQTGSLNSHLQLLHGIHAKVLLQEAAAALARGKRGKAKKAQTKYAHQDEEDKALALQLLDPAGKF